MTQSDVASRIRTLILEDLGWSGRPEDLTDAYPLIDNDVLDSMGIYQIVSLLEDEYGLVVPDESIVPESFESLAAIARMAEAIRSG